jgi:hypothetical protein
LKKALELVKPKTVYVFSTPPAEDPSAAPKITEEFLSKLTGLCKYTLNNYNGKTQVKKLASALASREGAVEIGLQWLAAGGHLSVTVDEDEVTLSAEKSEANQYLQKELYIALKGVLSETAAYRKYFASANLEILLQTDG